MSFIIPEKYKLKLLPETTEIAIKDIKRFFQQQLFDRLNLRRVTAPLFVAAGTGINDDLNGVEQPVGFNCAGLGGKRVEIVQSLAKWKRIKLAEYDIAPGYGIYTDMNAVRPDEIPDNLHSIYVDQWDWERTISPEDRTMAYLKATVESIYEAIRLTEQMIYKEFPHIVPTLPEKITFIHSEQLLAEYPGLTPGEREAAAARKYGAIFITGIGAPLSDGQPHDLRAPDYDDWSTTNEDGFTGLNGDIIVWDTVLSCPLELSSMGIRVDAEAMHRQLAAKNCLQREHLLYHKRLLNGELPHSIGGGIGQSRLCMFLLQKAHIGEVQASLWPDDQVAALRDAGIPLI